MGEPKFTKGPWSWFGSTRNPANFYLATRNRGRIFVMGFERVGMRGAGPTFQSERHIMTPASEMVRYDVAKHIIGKAAAQNAKGDVYREDFSEIVHPDAYLIAAAPDLYEALHNALSLLRAHTGPDDAIATSALDAGKAALAKARGEAV